jgi:hypothetical protein
VVLAFGSGSGSVSAMLVLPLVRSFLFVRSFVRSFVRVRSFARSVSVLRAE